jgi:anti-sigma-K factor RskA
VDTPLSHREFEELAAGWVLSVLEPDDEAAFRRHLATCERCERDVRELEGVVGDLAYAAPPAEPPAALWPTIRGQLGATARARPRRLRPPRAAGAARSPWVVRLAAAAGVVLLVGLALWNVSLRDANDAYRARVATLDQVVALANDPTTRAIALKGAPAQQGARVTVLASSRQDRGALLVEGLPPPPAGKVYELWGVPGGQIAMAQPAVVFLGSARPRSVLFSLPIQPTTVFAVTAEPAPHGSRKPTSQPILIGSPSAPA